MIMIHDTLLRAAVELMYAYIYSSTFYSEQLGNVHSWIAVFL